MAVYRVTLGVRSALATPLASDTLWGHVAWGYAYRHGDGAVRTWIEAHSGSEPPLVLSDPLPHGILPRPHVPGLPRPSEPPSEADADRHEAMRRVEWIAEEHWPVYGRQITSATFEETLAGCSAATGAKASDMHAAINRLTGGTAQDGGGTLYSVDRTYYDAGAKVDVWAATSESAATLRDWLVDGLAGGYGRDGASGSGWIEVESVTSSQLPGADARTANACMLLGYAVPAPSDPVHGFFDWTVRAGRIGGTFSQASTPSGSTKRQKRAVIMLSRGSVLVGEPRATVGRLLGGVHDDPAIKAHLRTLAIPLRLSEELVLEAKEEGQ
ncbi:MAG: hypothetical protein U0572_05710 [Phycisphaerales bacterium]